MPDMQLQNSNKTAARYRVKEIPSLLSQVQTRNLNQCKRTNHHNSQRARRTDAEPITRILEMRLSALLFLFLEVLLCWLLIAFSLITYG